MLELLLDSSNFLFLVWKLGIAWLLLLWVSYNAAKVVYNLYFHPLAKFPGPIFAAASDWWQVYVEVVKAESLSKKLVGLHEEFGACIGRSQHVILRLTSLCRRHCPGCSK